MINLHTVAVPIVVGVAIALVGLAVARAVLGSPTARDSLWGIRIAVVLIAASIGVAGWLILWGVD